MITQPLPEEHKELLPEVERILGAKGATATQATALLDERLSASQGKSLFSTMERVAAEIKDK